MQRGSRPTPTSIGVAAALVGVALVVVAALLVGVVVISASSSASSAYSSGEVATFSSWQIIDEGAWGGLWFAQAFSLFLLVFYLAFVLSHAIDSLNTWLRTIHRMFIRDFSTYLCALFVILTAFYLALYLLFPRSGERSLPQSLDFNECARQMRARATIPSSSRRPPRLAGASQHAA